MADQAQAYDTDLGLWAESQASRLESLPVADALPTLILVVSTSGRSRPDHRAL